jgi:transcription elongation GreA/GreB family factor
MVWRYTNNRWFSGIFYMSNVRQVVFENLLKQLETTSISAMGSAESARQLATHEQSKPETQYDTVGLEASYLAHGHSKRAAELQVALDDWKTLQHKSFDSSSAISAGALVKLIDSNDREYYFLVGNYSGGAKIQLARPTDLACLPLSKGSDTLDITVISLNSPLGKALKDKYVGDEFSHPVQSNLLLELVYVG